MPVGATVTGLLPQPTPPLPVPETDLLDPAALAARQRAARRMADGIAQTYLTSSRGLEAPAGSGLKPPDDPLAVEPIITTMQGRDLAAERAARMPAVSAFDAARAAADAARPAATTAAAAAGGSPTLATPLVADPARAVGGTSTPVVADAAGTVIDAPVAPDASGAGAVLFRALRLIR